MVPLSVSHSIYNAQCQLQTSDIVCEQLFLLLYSSSSSSRMLVMNHNWSAMKQHLHLQSVAEISSFVRGQDSTMSHIVG